MATPGKPCCAAVLALLLHTTAIQAQPAPGGSGYRAGIEGAARELARQMEWLQDAIYNNPQRQQGRDLWNSSEKVNLTLIVLQNQLKSGAPRKDLFVTFTQLESRVDSLLGDIGILGEGFAPLKRAADRVRSAEHDLHFAVTAGTSDDGLRSDQLRRQTLALEAAAQDLENLGKYLLDGQDAWTFVGPDLRKLRQAAGGFHKGLKGKLEDKQLQRQFAGVQKAWQDLTVDYSLLPRNSGVLMQNYAARLDAIYGRLYGLAGMKGERAKLPGGS